jgi:hypothetical protein
MRRSVFCDQRRDATQRRLFVGQALEILAGLRIRDGRRHQLRERGDSRLGIFREQSIPAPRGTKCAP